eukprot:5304576-Pyramimonas_sp.AAC.1
MGLMRGHELGGDDHPVRHRCPPTPPHIPTVTHLTLLSLCHHHDRRRENAHLPPANRPGARMKEPSGELNPLERDRVA